MTFEFLETFKVFNCVGNDLGAAELRHFLNLGEKLTDDVRIREADVDDDDDGQIRMNSKLLLANSNLLLANSSFWPICVVNFNPTTGPLWGQFWATGPILGFGNSWATGHIGALQFRGTTPDFRWFL